MMTRRPSQSGFTLVELLVVCLIVMSVGGMLFLIADSGLKTWLFTDAQLESQTEVQRAIDRMSDDLREAPLDEIDCVIPNGPLTIGLAGTAARITYRFTAGAGLHPGTGTLVREVGDPMASSATIASNIVDGSFTCTDPANQVVSLSLTSRGRTTQGRVLDQAVNTSVWIQLAT